MKKVFSRTHYFLIIVLLLSGCASMEAVQKYASSTQSTIESVKPVAKDFYASCRRTNSFKPLSSHSECETEQKASKAILQVANVLDEYAVALGSLAADELVSYDTDINVMTKEIKDLKVKGLEDDKVDAIGGLAKFIAKAATTAYQQKQVAQFIKESNDSVMNVSKALADIIEENYSQAITLEISAWEDRYKIVEKVARTEKPLEWETYSKAQWKDRVELEAKLNAVKNLSKNIREIGATHAKLKKDADKLTSKEVAAFVQNFIKEAKPVIKEIQDTFLTK